MNRPRRILVGPSVAGSLVALAIAGCGSNETSSTAASGGPATPGSGTTAVDVADSSLGRILVDAEGRTLYVFEKDTGSKSMCFGACASAWPPFRPTGPRTPVRGRPPR